MAATVYVRRVAGQITCLWRNPHPEATEQIAEDHADVAAFLAPKPPIDLSNLDNLPRALKALGLMIADWTSHTPAQAKTLFKQKWDSLG